jgi:O-antigen/teichoic acid export membrane protein
MLKKIFSSQLRINMASGTITTVINSVTLVVAFPIYLHFLGYDRYGLWLVLTTVLSFAQLGNLGISKAVMKLVAEEYGRGDVEGIQRCVTTALSLLFLSGMIIFGIILVFKYQIIAAFRLTGEDAEMISLLLPYIGCLSVYVFMVQVLNAVPSGLGRIDLANYIQSFGRIVAVTIASILLYSGRGIESLLIGNAVSYVFIHIASFICINRIVHIRILRLKNLDIQRGKIILRFGGAVIGGSLMNMMLSPFNKLMLSRYAGVSSIPIYEIAFRGSMEVRSLVEAGFRALMPEISRIGANMTSEAKDRIMAINKQSFKLILFAGASLFALVFVFAGVLLQLWLGDEFVEILPYTLRILLIASFASLIGVPAYYTHMGQGRVHHCFISHIILSLINVVVVIAYAIISPEMIESRIYYAILLGQCGSTAYLVWQLYLVLYTPNDFNEKRIINMPTAEKI